MEPSSGPLVFGRLSRPHVFEGDFSSFELDEAVLVLFPLSVGLDQRRISQDDLANATLDAVFVERRVEVDEAFVFTGNRQTSTLHHFVTASTAVEAVHVRTPSGGRGIAGGKEGATVMILSSFMRIAHVL